MKKGLKREKLDWDRIKKNDKVVAISISVRKNDKIYLFMISKDKDVVINFGSEHWIPFLELFELEDEIDDKAYHDYINDPKNKKNYKETKEVINNSSDFTEIAKKFYRDFRTDRGNRIRIDLVEGETKEQKEKLKKAFRRIENEE